MQNKQTDTNQRGRVAGGSCCAVLAVLILYPLFGQYQDRVNENLDERCLANVKQVGLGLRMYEEDYDDRFPLGSTWMAATYPFIKNKYVYGCPVLHKSHPNDFGYAFNSSLSLQKLDKRKAPEKTAILYDSNDLRWNANAPGRTGMANPARHAGGNIIGFADGHAKIHKMTATDE